ncbi:MAG: TraR/DksA C4-type zinc finger protein [Anaerolineae bacterium]|nr:TraR/DksA C4-type zinc finger protein [Anaerolineae bacterium]MCB9131731.1 TraR/DksA C4-type zinc finger protein [Anaerolineales bacterium]MCB0230386.1 TraR/DksA C4-type zinc finger protein [Anaerolineae bacterium]MCB0240393.1 TraR/DksA C4-type zinc finger protein [Anaerolineae bacterium]MCB0243713.1 TraR/DksA C4-type zinc finger protein [Anaerolineae bacterium]
MSKDAQEVLRAELLQARRQLADLDRQLQHKPDFEIGEGSPAIITWEMNLARRSVLLRRIDDFERALERDSAGAYGTCEYCGAQINPERLRILPHTRQCIKCANIPKGSRPSARTRQRTAE